MYKIKVMSLSTFFIGLIVVSLVAIFVAKFWIQLLLVWTILRAAFWIGVGAFVSAFLWMIFVEGYTSGPIGGFWIAMLFFFITYSITFIVFVFITLDIYKYFKGFIRDVFKK